jgi:hypothetical protein
MTLLQIPMPKADSSQEVNSQWQGFTINIDASQVTYQIKFQWISEISTHTPMLSVQFSVETIFFDKYQYFQRCSWCSPQQNDYSRWSKPRVLLFVSTILNLFLRIFACFPKQSMQGINCWHFEAINCLHFCFI